MGKPANWKGAFGDDKPKKKQWNIKRTPLKRPTKAIKRSDKPIAKESPASKISNREYRRTSHAWKLENPFCEAIVEGCTVKTTEVHHMRGRSGSLLLDLRGFFPSCHSCHRWITDHNNKAVELGFTDPPQLWGKAFDEEADSQD